MYGSETWPMKVEHELKMKTGKGFSLKLKGNVYASCVRSCLIWPMKAENEVKLNRTEMSMITWI